MAAGAERSGAEACRASRAASNLADPPALGGTHPLERHTTMRRFAKSASFFLLLALLLPPRGVAGQEIPSPAQVLGYELGERFTPVAGVVHYFNRLAGASDLVSVHPYGETNEGRPLLQVLVASAAHRARLEEILDLNRELTDPETSEARAREIVSTNPAVVYLSYGVHGSESSSPEAALWTAWDLVRGAADVAGVLDSVVVVIDPVLNPDGRDRYVNFYRQAVGVEPNPDRNALEHSEPWPGGRPNHYLFDLNRDWAWNTQVETRQRLATWGRWNPQVHVDFHEMGSNSSYFFFPPAKPINPIFPEHVVSWADRIGRGNAQAFDEQGWMYYTAEGFDLFYPGYGDSWPSLLGGIGMTYEQAGGGGAGLVTERSDGSRLTLFDRASRHRVAGNATLRTAATGRTDLLLGFAAFHRNIDQGVPNILLVPGDDPERVHALVEHLQGQGIRVERAAQDFRAQAQPHPGFSPRQSFPEGTFLVRARQPRGRLAGALLMVDHLLDAESSYDITAWSLPFAYGVEAHSLTAAPGGSFQPVSELPERTAAPRQGRIYAYLMTPGFGKMPALVRFLKDGGRAYAQPDTFRTNGTLYPAGTLFLPRERNADLEKKVADAGLEPFLVPVSTGLTQSGRDLGTGSAGFVTLPKVALLGGEGVSSGSYGAHWFFLEQRLGLPFNRVPVSFITPANLADYDVLVVPEGLSRPSEPQTDALREWVRGGGTLVAVGNSAQALGRSLGEVEMRSEAEEDLSKEERLDAALQTREERRTERWERSVPGAIVRVNLDPGHPLAAGASADGLPGEMFVLTRGRSFEPKSEFESVAFFPAGPARASGVISEGSMERLARSSWMAEVTLGRGSLVLFAEDPLFRMFWYSGFQLYSNAVLLGPAF